MLALAWKLVAILALLGAALAVALPVLPALPFLLLAAVAAARGWPWLEQRLAAHPTVGPVLADWRRRGALPRSLKVFGVAGMAVSGLLAWAWPAPAWLALLADGALLAGGLWLWTRPTT